MADISEVVKIYSLMKNIYRSSGVMTQTVLCVPILQENYEVSREDYFAPTEILVRWLGARSSVRDFYKCLAVVPLWLTQINLCGDEYGRNVSDCDFE